MSDKNIDKYDINGPNFDSDLYLERLFKESSLRQIMDQESEIVKDTQTLRSVMQTLVYENYNKFISATDTIRKMKTDFKKMETEMDLLASNMESIMSSSDQISSTLHDTRQQISKLSGVHSLLKKLQFLFKLPATLKVQLDEENYEQAVQDYLHAQRVLQQYGDLPSLHGIQSDCTLILQQIKVSLHNQLTASHQEAQHLPDTKSSFSAQPIPHYPTPAVAVDLLLKLGEPARELCVEYLACAGVRLDEQINELRDESDRRDVVELIDMGCDGVVGEMCVVVASWWEMVRGVARGNGDIGCNNDVENSEIFENFAATDLETFIESKMSKYFSIIQNKVEVDAEIGDTSILVAALDRFYRRLNAMHSLCRNIDFASKGVEIIINASRKQCKVHLQALKLSLNQTLTKVRQSLSSPKLNSQEENLKNLTELLNLLTVTTVEKIKGVLQDLAVFIHKDVNFAKKAQFKDCFCIDNVREGLIVCFLHHLTATCRTYCTHNVADPKVPPTLLLILSKFCLDLQNGHLHFILSQTDELFSIPSKNSSAFTTEAELSGTMRESAQELLNCFVRIQGLNVSQMLRKSVETRDWLHTIEPRTVRAVMKRVVEDIAAVDSTVALLYEDQGINTEHSSDSSRKTHSISISRQQYRSNWSSYTPSHLESALVSNMHKLFSERIEIFSSVEFNKVSILTGIIKISLKTFMECVRLKTFSKFGLQQIQVDTHYLQLYLWRFVADENLVHFLLDEILGSAVHRCLDPILMEPSVVDIICERG